MDKSCDILDDLTSKHMLNCKLCQKNFIEISNLMIKEMNEDGCEFPEIKDHKGLDDK